MQNISAVLALNDLPYITGLTPADAFQNLLEEMLLERLESDPAERAMVLSYGNGLLQRWTRPEATSQLQMEAPPEGSAPPEPKRTFKGSKIDHAAREHACRRLGRSGEEVVLAYERQQLTATGRTDLAEAVEHISRTEGDGTGYDILSYTPEEAKKYIEVKTTNFDKTTSFLITDNEVAFSATQPGALPLVPAVRVRVWPQTLHPSRPYRTNVLDGGEAVRGGGEVTLLTSTRSR
ncbi:MAG: DUF3883 domain-containing protein [Flavobacteriales bacterium]|nr:DUF3883 domain-containing protein [Flavobacteriales bacterium]